MSQILVVGEVSASPGSGDSFLRTQEMRLSGDWVKVHFYLLFL